MYGYLYMMYVRLMCHREAGSMIVVLYCIGYQKSLAAECAVGVGEFIGCIVQFMYNKSGYYTTTSYT